MICHTDEPYLSLVNKLLTKNYRYIGVLGSKLNLFREYDYSRVPVETVGQLRKAGSVFKVIVYHFTTDREPVYSKLSGSKLDFLTSLGIKRSSLSPPKIYYYGRSGLSKSLQSDNRQLIEQFWNNYSREYPIKREQDPQTIQSTIELLDRGLLNSHQLIKLQNSLNLYNFGDLSVRIPHEQVVEMSHYLEQFRKAFLVKKANSYNIYPLIKRVNQICSLVDRSSSFPDNFSKKMILYYSLEEKHTVSIVRGSRKIITQVGNDFSKFSKTDLQEIRRYISSINNVTGYYYPLINQITKEIAERSKY